MSDTKDQGRMPPSNKDLEEKILGALLLEGEKAYSKIAPIIENNNVFYYEKNEIIYDSIKKLIDKKEDVDIATVAAQLMASDKIKDIGGPLMLAKITKTVGSAAHVKTHTRMLKQLWISRRLITISNAVMIRSYNLDDVFTIYKDFDLEVSNLFTTTSGKAIAINDAIDGALYDIKGRMDGTAQSRIKTNSCFDEIIDVSPNELIWIGALPKAGKTKSIIKIASSLLKNNDNIAINWYSMEDDQTKLLANIGSMETKIRTKVILGKEDVKLTDSNYTIIKDSLSTYRDYDLKIAYGTHSVDSVFLESKNFVRQRKDKFNIIIIDNFNILRDAARGKDNLAKEDYVAAKIQQLKLETNSEGSNTCIFVLDHLNKEAMRDLSRMAGRPAEATLTGSGRKSQILTQLVSVNKPSEFPELVDEEHSKKPLIINNTVIERKRIFDKLLIYEVLKSRESSSVNKILRVLADFDNMQFQSLNNFIEDVTGNKKPKEITVKEEIIEVIEEEKVVNEKLNLEEESIDTSFLNKKDVEDVPF